MKRNLFIIPGVLLALALVAPIAHGADKTTKLDETKLPPASDKKGVTFDTDIKPIFQKSCVKCHGADRQKGKLRLDTREATLKGGQDGKVIEPGKSTESMLVANVAHLGDEDDFMPPPDNKDKIPPLTKEQIGLIRAWIDQGAK